MSRVRSGRFFSEAELSPGPFDPGESLGMNAEFVEWLDALRERLGEPMMLNSAERTKDNPIEAKKANPTQGAHVLGCAVDVHIPDSHYRYRLIKLALEMGVEGFGMEGGFIHLDKFSGKPGRESGVCWVY